jgi:hypothetical protein
VKTRQRIIAFSAALCFLVGWNAPPSTCSAQCYGYQCPPEPVYNFSVPAYPNYVYAQPAPYGYYVSAPAPGPCKYKHKKRKHKRRWKHECD